MNVTAYGFIVLLIPWPKLLTYLSGAIVCLMIIDAILSVFGFGVIGDLILNMRPLKKAV